MPNYSNHAAYFSSIFWMHFTMLKSSRVPSFLTTKRQRVSTKDGFTSTTKCLKSFIFSYPRSWNFNNYLTRFVSFSLRGVLLGLRQRMFLKRDFNLLISSYFSPPNSNSTTFLALCCAFFSSLILLLCYFFKLSIIP